MYPPKTFMRPLDSSRWLTRIFLCVISFLPLSLSAQDHISLSGRVLDGAGSPLIGANIALYQGETLASGATTNGNGTFAIAIVSTGQYKLQVSYVGYKPYTQDLTLRQSRKLGEIILHEDAEVLDAVVVTGKATDMTVKGDTLIFNADAYKAPQGAMLEDLVKRLPGAEVDDNGNISINGQSISKIMLDGKEFFSGDTKVASKNLPAEVVKQLEVVNKKSDNSRLTGFDDDDEETVLNIRTNSGGKKGTFGNAFVGYGYPTNRYEANGLFNRFQDKYQYTIIAGSNNTNNQGFSDLNLGEGGSSMRNFQGRRFGGPGSGGSGGIITSANVGVNGNYMPDELFELNTNARYGFRQQDLQTKTETENIIPNATSTFTSDQSKSLSRSEDVGADAWIDWKVSDRTELIFRPVLRYSWGTSTSSSSYETVDTDGKRINSGDQSSRGLNNALRSRNRLIASHRFNERGSTLSAQAMLGFDRSKTTSENSSTLKAVDLDESERNKQDNNSKNLSYFLRLNYVEPITDLLSLQARVEWTQNIRHSERLYFTPNADDLFTIKDETRSTVMSNTLSQLTGGLDAKFANKLFDLTVGFYVRPTTMVSTQSNRLDGEPITLKQMIYSPNLHFRYNPNKQTSLRLGYQGMSEMPSVNQMYAVPDMTNLRQTIVGNPELRPYFSHHLFGMFRTFSPKGGQALNLNFFGMYRTNDVITDTQIDAATNKQTITYANSKSGSYNVNLNGSFTTPIFTRSLTLGLGTRTSYSYGRSIINKQDNESKVWRTTNDLSLAYTNSWIYVRAKGGLTYMNSVYTLQPSQSANTYDWSVGGDLSFTLPLGFKIETDVVYTKGLGYQQDYNVQFVDWNAALSYSFLKNNAATIRFKVYDILNQKSTISRQVSATAITDSWSNSIGRYMMIHFIYRFSLFSNGGSAGDMQPMGGPGFFR